jgi:hypothetical protein
MLVHLHDFGGVDDGEREAGRTTAQRCPETILRADQKDVEIGDLPQRPQGAFHRDMGRVIASHGIQRDPHGHVPRHSHGEKYGSGLS